MTRPPLPPGVDWLPVDAALARLRARITPITGDEAVPLALAGGRILARAVHALRASPPQANSAVDGYGFAHATAAGVMPLAPGRAAAGQVFAGAVPPGHALRILTGASLPHGVDTVCLQEDTRIEGDRLHLRPPRAGANTRPAGEDMAEGAPALPAGRRLTPADLALMAAVGLGAAPVRPRLRVGVISTGDELREPGAPAAAHQIWDANRAMLLGLVAAWGFVPVDMGIRPDDAGAIRAGLDQGAAECDAILTSGGASAGDEDHISRLLRTEGALTAWRIAMKPGRPLALADWRGVPVFGLPGNPVAAFVCALIFARPALMARAGGGWVTPQGFMVPAAFTKTLRPGRREWLRARLDDAGRVEIFASEGSGRISGISWATGLADLGDAGADIRPGDPVRFLPFSAFGLG